jgi:hypothetical protein
MGSSRRSGRFNARPDRCLRRFGAIRGHQGAARHLPYLTMLCQVLARKFTLGHLKDAILRHEFLPEQRGEVFVHLR